MWNIREFRKKPDRLSDFLPWAALIGPGIVLNKDGSFQKTFRFRGPDLASATRVELVSVMSRINNVLKRLGGNWGIYVEAQRVKSAAYPDSQFPDAVSRLIDEERRRFFSAGNHYESAYYLTLVYLPPAENQGKVEEKFISRAEKQPPRTFQAYLKFYVVEVNRIINLFKELFPEAAALDDAETLTYLHSTISTKRHDIVVPPHETMMYLDALLPDMPLLPGLEPKLGNSHLRVISVLGYPTLTSPGLLDKLNHLDFEYRWVSRFLPLDKIDAEKEIANEQRRWWSKRKSVFQLVQETITGNETALVDNDAHNKAADADLARQCIAADMVSFGYFTPCIVVWDRDLTRLERKIRDVEAIINGLGYATIEESLNAVDAWFGSIPGFCRANVRRPLMSSINLAHQLPLSATWAGPKTNKCLDGPVLLHCQTDGKTPFRLSLHVGDVGHAMVIGPTGGGKSVHLALIAAQFRRYPNAQVYIFDKGGSSRALTAGVGGEFYDLADEDGPALSFQPLARIDEEKERAWAAEWLYDFLRGENVEITPFLKKAMWTALTSLATAPREERTITGLRFVLQDETLRSALDPLTLGGPFGSLFDAKEDGLGYSSWQVFEMEKIMQTAAVVPPTLSYLFHRLEQRLDGKPTLIILDECWVFLDNPIFAERIREWLKTFRKKNASVVFATQSLQDVASSTIAPAIMESCHTKIFLPNSSALSEQVQKTYFSFDLNEKETEILSKAVPKKQYYYKSVLGCRLYELAVSEMPITLAYCASSGPEDQAMVKKLLSTVGPEGFNSAWLRYKNVNPVVGERQANHILPQRGPSSVQAAAL